MQGKEFLVVIDIEHRLGGIDNAPCYGDADLHGVAQAVVDLLAVVAQGHDLEGELFAGGIDLKGGAAVAGGGLDAQRFHVTALAQAGLGGGVYAGTEGIDIIVALTLQGAVVPPE